MGRAENGGLVKDGAGNQVSSMALSHRPKRVGPAVRQSHHMGGSAAGVAAVEAVHAPVGTGPLAAANRDGGVKTPGVARVGRRRDGETAHLNGLGRQKRHGERRRLCHLREPGYPTRLRLDSAGEPVLLTGESASGENGRFVNCFRP